MIISSVLVSLLLVLPTFSIQASFASSPTSCAATDLHSRLASLASDVSSQSAMILASQYLSAEGWAVQSITFNSIFYNLQFDKTTCQFTMQSVGVVYDSRARNVTIEVIENTQTTSVLNTTTHVLSIAGKTYWSGYQFNHASSYDSETYWTVPRAGNPDTNYCGNGFNQECILAVWIGESTSYGGQTGFAQGGSFSVVNCLPLPKGGWSCSSFYQLWYEYPPAGWSVCTSNVLPNDIVWGVVAWSSNTEYVQIIDETSGATCYSQKSGVSEPSWVQFMAEFPSWSTPLGSGYYYLPYFTTFKFYEAEVNFVPISQLSNPYPSYMTNGPNGEYNIILGPLSYSGSLGAYFTQTWQTSSGT